MIEELLKDNKIEVSWEQFTRDCITLSNFLKEKDYKTLISITRGGLFVAGQLSYLLDIRDVRSICVKSYSNKGEREKTSYLYKCSLRGTTVDKSLLVEDIVDTGQTLLDIFELKEFRKICCACLYVRSTAKVMPGFFSSMIMSSSWIEMPWEV